MDEFCGVSFDADDVFYHEMVSVTQSECGLNEWSVCVTPSGAILVGEMSIEECANVGYCTVKCPREGIGLECLPVDARESSLCYNNSDVMDEMLCEQMSGMWVGVWGMWGAGMCTFPLQNDKAECGRNGNTFIECGGFDVGDCVSNGFLTCYLSNSTSLCGSKQECEGSRGWCTDSDYFMNYLTSPPTYGSCVVPFAIDISDGNRSFCNENTIPISLGYRDIEILCFLYH